MLLRNLELQFKRRSQNEEGAAPVASIVTVNPSTTVMDLSCPTDVSGDECGWGEGLEYTIISTTIYQATMIEVDEFTMTFKCEHNTQASEMSCAASVGGGQANDPGTTNTVLKATEFGFLQATVTAGGDLLADSTSGGSAAASSVAKTASSLKTIASSTGTAATGSQASGTASSATGSGSPAQSTGAAGRFVVEGSALLGLVGAAAWNLL
ncbi:hypothetical protein K491DRAFT_704493 [Lophiostoma macrostomum CBS 122681]|uniref:GPI anchored protein n=1 Tax=Lophiostoma macrostomum CBS 122681 TaxID=1314788 RepID=A0A6A6T9S7_9PLEO|nr:hypothetical protein K491DRAFT_704493 [Lophiostoma macrostomum CBS 122681]